MAAYSNNLQASSSLTDLGDPALFGDDDFSWMNTIPYDDNPAKYSTSDDPIEMTLPALQPQHVTRINNILPTPGPPPPPSIHPPFTAWPSDPTSHPASQWDEPVGELSGPQNKILECDNKMLEYENKILAYNNKILDLDIKLDSLKEQKSQADGRLTNPVAEVGSMRNIFAGIESPSAQDRVTSQLRSTGK